ncbi:hypothetical protein [Pedobacter sp. MC2016-24]|uniref:hypothetical protein n=1 Tax=Pedobacter sp. MC2016-24 TaxID=2780090 RepID=UPI0018823A28|nr:hypothetical protein [Pedobacter sp. MC2016-24]MBE9602458.1 hypothetical protein [Pedobacter sp. MC2016-24]
MRKLILLLLCTATLGLASCKKDTIVQETSNKSIIYDIAPNQWTTTDGGKTYTNIFTKIPEIDQYGLENEGTLVYISYNNETSYIQVPFVYNLDSYSYEVSNNKLVLTIQSSSFSAPNPTKPITNVRVKVVIVAAKNVV